MVIRWDNGICHGGIERQCVFHGRVDGGLIQKHLESSLYIYIYLYHVIRVRTLEDG